MTSTPSDEAGERTVVEDPDPETAGVSDESLTVLDRSTDPPVVR